MQRVDVSICDMLNQKRIIISVFVAKFAHCVVDITTNVDIAANVDIADVDATVDIASADSTSRFEEKKRFICFRILERNAETDFSFLKDIFERNVEIHFSFLRYISLL